MLPALALVALVVPTPAKPSAGPPPGAGAAIPLVMGAPEIRKTEILDGGYDNIDKGVLVTFAKNGRRYEVWEVHPSVATTNALVLAFDAAGNELWRTKLEPSGADRWSQPLAITTDVDNNVWLMYLGSSSHRPWRVVKVDADGTIAVTKTLYTTTWEQERTFMAAHPQGGVVVHAVCDGGATARDLYTARIAANGDVLWERKYDVGEQNQYAGGLAVAADGSIYAVGDDKQDAGAAVPSAVRIRKYRADGSVAWTKSFDATTQYERPIARDVFIDSEGDLMIAGSTYAGGSKDDWYFVLKYDAQGQRLRRFAIPVEDDKLTEYGLQGVYATHAPDDSVYIAWDHGHELDSGWTLVRVRVPGEDPPRPGAGKGAAKPSRAGTSEPPKVEWTKTFTGDAAMNVERLVWFPQGGVGVLGRGKRVVDASSHAYRQDTRLRLVRASGVDEGMVRSKGTGNFHHEPTTIAVSKSGLAFVLGWRWWNEDGWNDENVLRLTIGTGK